MGLAAAALLAGCGGGGGKQASSTGGLTAAQVASRADTHTSRLRSFHFHYDVANPPSGGSGLVLTSADGDVAVPSRLKANVSGTYSGIPLNSQIVFSGGKAYLKNPLSGSWQSFPTETSPTGYFDPSKGVLAVIGHAHTLRLDGTETVDGAPCYRLRGSMPASVVAPFLIAKPGNVQVPVDVDVGEQDFVLRRIRIDGPVNSSEPKDIRRTITLSRFDEPVTVAPPRG